jgi:hypothetical protein
MVGAEERAMTMTIPRIANGFIGLSMLAMLAVAIVAGQVRAKPGAQLQPVTEIQQLQPHARFVLELQNIKRFEALPAIADTLLDLPFVIEIDVEAGLITATRRAPLEGNE